MIEALRASPCLSSNCAVAPCRAPPPHLLAASRAPHAARRLNRAEASHQPSLGRALALHPRSISLSHRYPAATVRAPAHSLARPSIRPLVRSSIHPLPFVLTHSLSLALFRVLSHGRSSSRFLFPPARTTNRHSLGYSDARLPLSAVFLAPPRPRHPSSGRCALCAMRCAPHSPVCVGGALCALRAAVPSPARARCAARRNEASGG